MEAMLELTEVRPTVRAKGHNLTIKDGRTRPKELPNLTQLGECRREILVVPAECQDSAAFDVEHGPYAVPLDFVGPTVVIGGQRSGSGEHRSDASGKRFEVLGCWVHAMDHPVLAMRREEYVATLRHRPMEDDFDLSVGPLFKVVVPGVQNAAVTAAVLTRRYVALKAAVFQGVILSVDSKMICRGVYGETLGQRPSQKNP